LQARKDERGSRIAPPRQVAAPPKGSIYVLISSGIKGAIVFLKILLPPIHASKCPLNSSLNILTSLSFICKIYKLSVKATFWPGFKGGRNTFKLRDFIPRSTTLFFD